MATIEQFNAEIENVKREYVRAVVGMYSDGNRTVFPQFGTGRSGIAAFQEAVKSGAYEHVALIRSRGKLGMDVPAIWHKDAGKADAGRGAMASTAAPAPAKVLQEDGRIVGYISSTGGEVPALVEPLGIEWIDATTERRLAIETEIRRIGCTVSVTEAGNLRVVIPAALSSEPQDSDGWKGYPLSELEHRQRIMSDITDLMYDAQGRPGTRTFNQSSLVDDIKMLIEERNAADAERRRLRDALIDVRILIQPQNSVTSGGGSLAAILTLIDRALADDVAEVGE